MREQIRNAQRIVVKVGTSSLTFANGKINLMKMEQLSRRIVNIANSGKEVILVSSGAVGVGMGKLNLSQRPEDVVEKQAIAAVGQCELMHIYSKFFSEYGRIVGQILLTKDVVSNEATSHNAKNTFNSLLEKGIIPIVNENDSVSVDELISSGNTGFGDNDTLSALVAVLVKADLLVILTDIDGFYEGNPREIKDARIIPLVRDIDDTLLGYAGGNGSLMGTGGMVTKLQAASICMEHNIDMALINGNRMDNIQDLLDGRELGTLFKGRKN
ncbi:MAG: glutamate 5-kinase [Clostridia bacterium]